MAMMDDVCWCCGKAHRANVDYNPYLDGPWCDACVAADRPVMDYEDIQRAAARLARQEQHITVRLEDGEIVLSQLRQKDFRVPLREVAAVIGQLQRLAGGQTATPAPRRREHPLQPTLMEGSNDE